MNQVGTIKRIDQYERVYVPKQILEALGLEKETTTEKLTTSMIVSMNC